jgi:hypothetical protein
MGTDNFKSLTRRVILSQTNPVAEIAALPAFVSSCSLIASYWTEEYRGRAWCQAELLMARAFCAVPVVMRVREVRFDQSTVQISLDAWYS